MSKMEEKVASLLNTHDIRFEREVSFSDLRSLKGKVLRFDFVLYDNRGGIIACIETDGQQHFQQVKHFQKTVFQFKQTKEWDRRKNSYCLRKQIPLIRIPYWEIDNLTFNSLFSNPKFRVTSIYHNDYLAQEVIK